METYLSHHGIKGQKWGVRRYQNPDGTLTAAGKKHKSSMTSEQKAKIAKSVIGGTLAAASVTALAVYVKKNPEAISRAINFVKASPIKVKQLSKTGIAKGKNYVKELGKNAWEGTKEGIKAAPNSLKEGIREGMKEAPKKAAKAIVVGAGLNIAKKALDKAVGSEESARIFQANDPKKIGKFWRVQKDED